MLADWSIDWFGNVHKLQLVGATKDGMTPVKSLFSIERATEKNGGLVTQSFLKLLDSQSVAIIMIALTYFKLR